jgi:hypothetical protein
VKLPVAQIKDLARSVLDEIDGIDDVRLASMECRASVVNLSGPLTVSSSLEVVGGQPSDREAVNVKVKYELEATTTDESPVEAWAITLEMIGTWRLTTPTPLESAALASFGLIVGALTIHPYARELVQSTVTRLGYTGYTMELLRSPADLPSDMEVELAGDN